MNNFTIAAADVEAIERATAAAVPPQVQAEVEGWLVSVDRGTVGRARSAVPLSHALPEIATVERIERLYAQHGEPTLLRLPRVPAFDALRSWALARGYRSSRPTIVKVAATHAVLAHEVTAEVTLAIAPDDDWRSLFLGPGFDPVDAASRLEILGRGRDTVYASAWADGAIAAVGAASFGSGWCGMHGMRTAVAHRGRGLARQVLAVLAQQANTRGMPRVFLQVEEANLAARSVYRRAGFSPAWAYEYWTAG